MPPRWTDKTQCAHCGTQPPKPMLCAACKTTYCSKECQRTHWPKHKLFCKNMVQQRQDASNVLSDVVSRKGETLSAEDLLMEMKKWSTIHATILGWAIEQALQAWLHPRHVSTRAVRIQLDYDAARRKPHQFTLVGVRVAAVPQETMDLEQIWIERCVRDTREIVAAGGLGMMMYALECGDISLCSMCGISAEEAPDPGDNMVLCTNYEEVFSKVISGNVSERRVLDAWASLIYAYHPFPDKKNETYLQVKLDVNKDASSALLQVRKRDNDQSLLPTEVRIPL